MKKFSNFMIYLNNLSDIYILSLVTVVFALFITVYCAKFVNNELKNKSKKEKKVKDSDESENDDPDDSLNGGFVGKLKTARLKKLEESLTEDQIEEEKRVEREQLAAIFELLKKQESELNTAKMDEMQLRQQLSLYR